MVCFAWLRGMMIAAAVLLALLLSVYAPLLAAGASLPSRGQILLWERRSSGYHIRVIDIDRALNAPLLPPLPTRPVDLPRLAQPARRLAFETLRESGLAIIALDWSRRVIYSTESAIDDRLASWSPDGTRLALWSNRLTPNANRRWQNWNFYLYDPVTEETQQLTSNLGFLPYETPVWSPDGEWIALRFYRPGVGTATYILRPADGELRNIRPFIDAGGDFAWSPDGRQIAFRTDRDRNGEVYLYDLETGATRNLSQHPATDFQPAWSPDGRSVAFVSNRDGVGDIFIMGIEDGRITKVSSGGGWRPVWSPDGERIAYLSNRGGSTALYVTSVMQRGDVLRVAPIDDQHTFLGWFSG